MLANPNFVAIQDERDERHILLRPVEGVSRDAFYHHVQQAMSSVQISEQVWSYDDSTKLAKRV